MSLATLPLPDDPTELRDLAVDLQAELARKDIEIAANAAEIHAKTLHIEKLKMQLAVLRRARFGRSSEKLDHAIEQLELLIGELEADAGAVRRATLPAMPRRAPVKRREANIRSASRCRHTCRARPSPTKQPAPAPPAAARCSAVSARRARGAGIRALHFKVIRHIRPKLSCRACETIVQPPMPESADRTRPARPRPARAGSGGEVLRPYAAAPPGRHLCPRRRRTRPLDLGRLGRHDRPIPAGSLGRGHRPPRPAGQVLHADDTTLPVLAPGTGKTRTGRLWVVVRDERPCGSAFRRPPTIATRRTARASTPRRCSRPLPRLPSCRWLCRLRQSIGPPRRTARRR